MSSQPSSTASKEITINASSLLSGLAFGIGAGVAAGAVYYLLNKENGNSEGNPR